MISLKAAPRVLTHVNCEIKRYYTNVRRTHIKLHLTERMGGHFFSITMCFEVKQYQLQMFEYSWNNNNDDNKGFVVMSRKIKSSYWLVPCADLFLFLFCVLSLFLSGFFSLKHNFSLFPRFSYYLRLSSSSIAHLFVRPRPRLDFRFHARIISDSNSSHGEFVIIFCVILPGCFCHCARHSCGGSIFLFAPLTSETVTFSKSSFEYTWIIYDIGKTVENWNVYVMAIRCKYILCHVIRFNVTVVMFNWYGPGNFRGECSLYVIASWIWSLLPF